MGFYTEVGVLEQNLEYLKDDNNNFIRTIINWAWLSDFGNNLYICWGEGSIESER